MIDELRSSYPKLFSKLSDEVTQLRYIVIIDENFNDVDSDEFDSIDPEDYNYMVYFTDLLRESIGKELFESLADRYESNAAFTDFYDADDGLYGIMTTLDEKSIANLFLSEIEQSL